MRVWEGQGFFTVEVRHEELDKEMERKELL